MVIKMKKRLSSIIIVLIFVSVILANIILAADWNTSSGSKVYFGVTFEQPNGLYYMVNSNRPIYRTYLTNQSGTEQDYSKNIFCLDVNGLFPTEVSSGTTSGLSSEYKSNGNLTTSSQVTLSSRSNSTKLSSEQIGKVLAIINKGYNYDSFQSKENIRNWIDDIVKDGWTEEDKDAISDLLDADDIFVLEQIAIWEITNGLDTDTLKETMTPNISNSWNSAESHKADAQAIILSCIRDIANDYQNNLPEENVALPTFSSKSSEKSAQKVNGYVFVGPFQIKNSENVKEYNIYSVKVNNNQETKAKLSNYGVYNGNNDSATSYGSLKGAGNNKFYIRIPLTTANTIDKIRIEIKSTTRSMILWNKENNNTAQPLVSFSEEEHNDSDEAEILKYDVALRKFITKINGVNIEDSREPNVVAQNDPNAFNGTDFKYLHEKEPVKVKVGDKVTYTIRVYNECDKNVIVKGIKDYLPSGLRIADDENNWQEVTDTNGNRYAVLKTNTDIQLNASNLSDSGEHVVAADRTITCIVTDEVSDSDILTNVAEITGLTDENGINVIDEDSEEDNLSEDTRSCPDDYDGESGEDDLTKEDYYYHGEEDEDDFEKLIVDYKVNIPVEKVWNDENNQDGIRPNEVVIKLLANGEDTGKTVTLNAQNNWQASFDNLPVKENGNTIIYTISESSSNGLEKYEIDIKPDGNGGFIITNTYTPTKININGTKTWNDNNNQDGIRPNSIIVNLYANGEKIDSKTVTGPDWTYSFTNLDEYKDGIRINYTIDEEVVENYQKEINNYDITNTYTPGKINIPVEKIWNDNNNQDGIRPDKITVKLLADGEDTGKTVELSDQNGWKAEFTDLDKNNNGKEIVYTIEELPVPQGYEVTISGDKTSGFTVTNTHTPEKIKIPVQKLWDDNSNQDGIRPDKITVKLLADGKDTGKTVELSEQNGWKAEFIDLDKNSNGKEIVYTVEENPVPSEYNANIAGNKEDGFIITNTYTPGKIKIPVEKIWNDNNNQDGIRPDKVTIKLLADGEDTGKTVELSDENNWKAEFTDLDKNNNGKEIVYTIVEMPVPEGYDVTISGDKTSGFTVTNSYTPGKINIPVEKVWDDFDNRDGIRPDKVTVKLLADGEDTGKTVELSDENNWKAEFIDLDRNNNGKEIVYTIEELPVPEGYNVTISGDKTSGFTITNSYTPEKIDIPVEKLWDDFDNRDGIRPDKVTIKLLADGEDTGKTVELSDENNWKAEFIDLDKNNNGKEIVYTIVEMPVPEGYEVTISGDKSSGFKVTNTHRAFDLALQKFITEVDEKVVTDRKPELTINNGEIEYTHTTEPYVVAHGNKVTYTIRIYNEGDIAGFPSIVKDDLPDGITFLPESEVNKKYEWKMYRKVKEDEDKTNLIIVKFDEKEYVEVEKVEEAEIIATDYYSYEKATQRGESAIKAYDKEVGLTDTNPDFRDLQVEFEVTETAVDGANRVIINTAEISDDEDEDGNEVEDKDSTPDNDKEEEDDIDKEYIQLKYFDLSLLKYVSEVEVTEDGEKKVTETGYDGTENPEPIVKVEIHRNKLKTTKVRYTYTIKITNEGEIEGYATEITDYIPDGLEFYEEDNEEYNWKTGEDGKITTDYLKDKLLKPGESAEVKLVLRWKNSSNNLGQKINTAEISDDENEYNAPDIDSTPDNKKDGEDDIDDAIVILSIKTGGTQLYIILTITIITILTAGGFIIYKYVYKPQEATILVDNNKYRHRK